MLIKQSILKSYEKQSITQRGTMVQNQCVNIAEQLYSTGYINGTDSEVVEMELFQLGNLYNGRIVIVDSGFQIIRDTYDIDEGRIIVSEEILKCFEGTNTMRYDKDNEFIEMTIPVEDEDGGITGVMVVSMPTTDIQDSREDLDRKVVILQIGMFIIILGGAFYASKILVKPFGKVTQSLDELTGGFLEEDISIPDYTETQLLSEAYNRMLKRMRVLEESRQEFVSNVSHELKTPITSIRCWRIR